MKRRMCTLLAFLLIFASTAVYAAEDIQSQLNLPRTFKQKASDPYGMELNITLPER